MLPGDGVLPLVESSRLLRADGHAGAISLELYQPAYYDRDPDDFLAEGHAKMLAVIERSSSPWRPRAASHQSVWHGPGTLPIGGHAACGWRSGTAFR